MEDSKEIWKDINGYEGLYQVSNYGRVKSLPHIKKSKGNGIHNYPGKILTPSLSNHYLVVLLYSNGKRVMRPIHRLVAETFLSRDGNELVVNHKNENKTDNRVENLEWITHQQNINHGTRNKRAAITSLNRMDCSKTVCKYDKEGNFVAEYPSISEASRQMNIGVCAIQNCIRGRSKSSCGFVWKFKDERNY